MTTIPAPKNIIKVANTPFIAPKIARQLATPKSTLQSRSSGRLDIRGSLLRTGKLTEMQVDELLRLKYKNTDQYILSTSELQVFKEIRSMVMHSDFDSILIFLKYVSNRNNLIWDQKIMDQGKIAIEKEISIQRYEEVGVKGIGKCKYCTSNELIFVQKQINSGDEPMKVFVRCVACQKHWKV